MSEDIQSFLATSPVFRDVPADQLEEIARLFRTEHHPAGDVILHQGGYSDAVYFLRSGRLAVRVRRGESRETVAYLQPPAIFGELSFVTGKSCVADVEVEVDADIILLPKEAVPQLPRQREAILRGLMGVIAGRLQDTVTQGTRVTESPIVLLRNHQNWEAPHGFAGELAVSLARQTARRTLLVNLGGRADAAEKHLAEGASLLEVAAANSYRAAVAEKLTGWKAKFDNVILNAVGPDTAAIREGIREFTNVRGDLLGPGDAIPEPDEQTKFVVQSAAAPTLPVLDGGHQLIYDAGECEAAFLAGRPSTDRFRRTVDSIARCIAGLQVGVALGGGAAWGWAHIGVLGVLQDAGIPIDSISGCSMGSVIGAFRAAGVSVSELKEIAEYWRTRTLRFVEWRPWRMCLLNEKSVRKTFRQYFGDRVVNQTEIPYWANAVDIQTGKEYTIRSGSLVECIRASIALPGLLPPLAVDSHLLLDAGIMDPVPVNLVRRMGCQFTIAINAMAALEAQKVRARYPFNAFDVMTRCMFVMGHEIGQARAEQSADVVFTPMLGDISMLQFSRSPEIIECGQKAAEQNLPAIQAGYERLKLSKLGRPQHAVNPEK